MKGTIKSRAEIENIFKTGSRFHSRSLMIIAKEECKRGSKGRVAFIAGKKLGNAPQRNYAKRIMRHALLHCKSELSCDSARESISVLEHYNLVFVAKKPLLEMKFKAVCKDIGRLIVQIGKAN